MADIETRTDKDRSQNSGGTTRREQRSTSPRYAESIEATTHTIHRLTVAYRNLVITVVVTVVASGMAAAIWRSPAFLLGILLLAPLCATFLALDSWLISSWRRRILELWAEGSLDLDAFRHTVTGIRALPITTLGAMLEPLPFRFGHPVAGPSRRLLTPVLHAIDLYNAYLATAVAVALASVTAGIVAAAIVRSWAPLLGALLITALAFATCRGMAMRKLRRSAPPHAAAQDAGIDPQTLAATVATFRWGRIPVAERNKLLAHITSTRR